MKYGQIIKPEDVPSLVRSGELRFGMVLEFSQSFGGPDGHFSQKFIGFNQVRDYCFVAFGSPEPGLSKELLSFRQARFPLPDLKDGDPVLVKPYTSYKYWVRKHFSHFAADESTIKAWDDGTHWTSSECSTFYSIWRLPTKKELREAGMENWFDGRIELEDE